MTLTAFLGISTNKSVPKDLTEYPIALSTFLFQPAATASLSKSQTALTHSSTGGLTSSSLFKRPITNARNKRKSDAKGGEIRYVFSFAQISLVSSTSSHIEPRHNRGLWFHTKLHRVHKWDHFFETFITPHFTDQQQFIHVPFATRQR